MSLFDLSAPELRRTPCPKCKRKGLRHPGHPHAFGYKDYARIECRYCKVRWKRKKTKEAK